MFIATKEKQRNCVLQRKDKKNGIHKDRLVQMCEVRGLYGKFILLGGVWDEGNC